MEMVNFVINNGYIKRGNTIYKLVKGFGMGLACAEQLANLGCYPVERDFATGKAPKEVEHNYRFIDDIETLTGCIPTEEEYGMQYKSTRKNVGEIVFLGMEQRWVEMKTGIKFITGMHFRDAEYPIRIRRYPGQGSMVTDSQRIGVVTGQFIRAQRLCSTLHTFKEAVQNVTLAAMRRGYKRGELDRVWGKFLVQWWKAEEVRRGELRSWYRKVTSRVHKIVEQENRGIEDAKLDSIKPKCKFGAKCMYKDFACPFEQQEGTMQPKATIKVNEVATKPPQTLSQQLSPQHNTGNKEKNPQNRGSHMESDR